MAIGLMSSLRNVAFLIRTGFRQLALLMVFGIQVDVVVNNRQFIHCRVSRLGLFSCWVTMVYASPVRIVRQHLWPLLDNIAINTQGPWIIGGDFNTIMNSTERRRGD